MLNLSVEWAGKEGFKRLIRYIENLSFVRLEAEATGLAETTVERMRNTIVENKKRPDLGTHKLENAIDWEEVLNNPGKELIIGIGNVDKLKTEAPYFEVLDSGGFIPNNGNFVPLGSFAPGVAEPNPANFREGQWQVGGGKFTFKAKKAIEGIDYIDSALRKLETELDDIIIKFGGSIIQGMGK